MWSQQQEEMIPSDVSICSDGLGRKKRLKAIVANVKEKARAVLFFFLNHSCLISDMSVR